LNRAACSGHKSARNAELGDDSFQYVSQLHSLPMIWMSVSRTERKLPPRSRVNCSASSVEAACKTLLFAQRSYSKSSSMSSLFMAMPGLLFGSKADNFTRKGT